MNKRVLAKQYKQDQEILYKVGVNYEKLVEGGESYIEEARRLWKEGVSKAGLVGISCPKCYKQITRNGSKAKGYCQCPEEVNGGYDNEDLLRAIGLEGLIKLKSYGGESVV